jgi:hypothetical protein
MELNCVEVDNSNKLFADPVNAIADVYPGDAISSRHFRPVCVFPCVKLNTCINFHSQLKSCASKGTDLNAVVSIPYIDWMEEILHIQIRPDGDLHWFTLDRPDAAN